MAAAAEPQLQISPADLRFRFEPRKNIPITLSLHNPTNERIAFKVKTTSPKKYCVRPSSGFVEPSSSRDVQVIMQAQKEFTGQGECKDKFLVQYVFAAPDVTEARAGELFENGRANVRQAKLRVVLQGPAKPPSPVPEGVEEDMASPVKGQSPADPRWSTFNAVPPMYMNQAPMEMEAPRHPMSAIHSDEQLMTLTKERNRLRDQVQAMERDNADIKRRLDALQLQNTGAPRTQGNPAMRALKPQPGAGGFTIFHLLIASFIAFLLGMLLS